MKDSKWIMIVVLLGVVAGTIQHAFLREEVGSLNVAIKQARKDYEKDLEDVYFLMKSDSSRLYTIMDTEIRILHYSKPHTEPMWCCPECAEQKKRASLDEPVPSVHRHKRGEGSVKRTGPTPIRKE